MRLACISLSALTLAACAHAPLPALRAADLNDGPSCARTGYDAQPSGAGFGCATTANLAAMVADPADLTRGREPGPPQGDAAFAAAARHRSGAGPGLPNAEPSAPSIVFEERSAK